MCAANPEDLRRRLRKIDRYCRDNSIRHLKLFGSVLGDLAEAVEDEDEALDSFPARLFGEDSDLDLLVEFEPGSRVTLFDMARMQNELAELIGLRVDLRTAQDLSRYFRPEVLDEAVELNARPA
ncbi:MAG: nucleotidyltransferase domain-containing protein [Acidobacteria bacterium]|nr:nucleotidyltransferase domain-containing protein [Acidobacteriota bacterium]